MKYLRVFDKEYDVSNLEGVWDALFSTVDPEKDKPFFDIWANGNTEQLLVEMNKQVEVEEKEK